MTELYPSIYLLPSEFSIGFSYLITRPQGNLLIPNGLQAANLADLTELLNSRGGVAMVLACCKHNVKAVSATAELCRHYGAPLLIAAPDARGGAITAGNHVRPLPFKEDKIDSEVDFIPLVGYTSGSAGYIWRNGNRTYLFTGVTLCCTDGAWKVWTTEPKATKCIEGFERIKQMQFDVMFLNSFSNSTPAWFAWTQDEKAAVMDEAIAQVKKRYGYKC
jgi:hypothetical protein